MQYKCFFIPVLTDGAEIEELNKFLLSIRVLSVDRQFSDRNGGWSILVSYYANTMEQKDKWSKKERVDYSKLLGEQEYKRFLELKNIRREVYTKEGVAAYMIFTDEELAEISRYPVFSKEMFDELVVGNVRRKHLEKYGSYFIDKLNEYGKNGESNGEDMLSPKS